VSDNGNDETGAYNLTYQRLNQPCNVTPLTCGQTAASSLSAVGEQDLYSFTAAVGDRATIRLVRTSGEMDPYLELYGPQGSRLDYSYSYAGNYTSIDATLTTAGVYTVVVSDNGNDETGAYNLTYQRLDQPCNATPLTCGQTLSGVLTIPGQQYFHTFTAEASDPVTIRMAVTAGAMNPSLELFGPDGASIASEYTDWGTYASLDKLLPATGVYTVIASDAGNDEAGHYRLIWQHLSDPCNATELVDGERVEASLQAMGQHDFYVFSGQADEKVTLRLSTATELHPSLELYSDQGAKLDARYSEYSDSVTISRVLAAAGKYTVIVRDYGSNAVGNYSLLFYKGDTAPPEATVTSPNGGEIVEPGTTVKLQWSATAGAGIADQDLHLSTDSGATFPYLIASALGPDVNVYDWTPPADTYTSHARVRVTVRDKAGHSSKDNSDRDFMILESVSKTELTYKYDRLNRLTEVANPAGGGKINYAYDAVGNRTSLDFVGPDFTKNYYFPYYPTATSESAGFAVSCYGDGAAYVQLALRGPDGALLPFDVNPHAHSIPAHQQIAKMGYELFSTAQPVSASAEWVEMLSTVPVGTFFQMLSADRMDGAVAFTEPYSRLFLTRVCEGASAFRGQRAVTRVSIANPTASAVTLKIRLLDAAGAPVVAEITRTIPAKGVLSGALSELFSLNRTVSGGYVDIDVTAGAGVVAFESVLLPDHNSIVGLNAQPTSVSQMLYSAQLACLPVMYTSVKLVNTGGQTRSVVLTPINEQGEPLSNAVTRSLSPGSTLEVDAASLFGFQADAVRVGSLRVQADGPGVIGDVIFGDSTVFTTAAALPLQTGGFRKAVFSQVANGLGMYNGLALFNPGTETAHVTIEVFTAQGVKSGERELDLAPGHRLSRLLPEPELMPSTNGQIGGYIILQSSHPLVAQEMFGTPTLLSAVPPMVME
jgi:hypothetical protein